MSRAEKNIKKAQKRKKLRFISKFMFIIFMSINVVICAFIVDINAKSMLGEDSINIKNNIKYFQKFIESKIGELEKKTKHLILKNDK